MARWLVKTEPETYSFEQLLIDQRTSWDHVRNYTARMHLMAMKVGDEALFYHSNIGKECVGIMEIVEEHSPDPTADEGSPWVIVRVAPVRSLAHPVTLAAIKADPVLADMDLIRQSRLSVGRVTPAEWKHILKKSEKPGG